MTFAGAPLPVDCRRLLVGVALALVIVCFGSFPAAVGPAAAGSAAAGSTAASPALPFGLPLPGRPPVLRRFEVPPDPYAPGHRGVDLGAPIGTAVRAAGTGVVGFAGAVAGRGVMTVMHPGGLRSTYEPVTPTGTPGTPVARGEQIGWLAAPTGHCGPGTSCLHWGVLRGSIYLDPLSLLGFAPVRLFPPDGPAGGGSAGGGSAGGGGASTGDGARGGALTGVAPLADAPLGDAAAWGPTPAARAERPASGAGRAEVAAAATQAGPPRHPGPDDSGTPPPLLLGVGASMVAAALVLGRTFR